jgi:hypothetical protein
MNSKEEKKKSQINLKEEQVMLLYFTMLKKKLNLMVMKE